MIEEIKDHNYHYIRDTEMLTRYVGFLVICVTIAAVYGVIQHYIEVDVFRLTNPICFLKHVNDNLAAPVRVSGFFSSYMTFSGQLSMMLPVICSLLIAVTSVYKRILLLISVFLVVFALFWTYTRSAWIGAICGLLAMGGVRGKKLAILFVLLSILAGGLLLWPGRLDRNMSMLRDKDEERIYTWITTIDAIREHAFTGIGKNNYSRTILPYRERRYGDYEFSSNAHAHNNILQVTVTGGLITGLCFLWLWGTIMYEMYRTYRQIPRQQRQFKWLAAGLFGGIIAFFMQGLFEHNWGDGESVMMMWLLIAFSLRMFTLFSTKHR